MTVVHTRLRRLLAVAVACGVAVAGCGIDEGRPPPSGSTLDATIAGEGRDPDLRREAGEPLVDRTELAPRGRATREVARVAQLSDPHVRDEESPGRVPYLDRFGPPATSAFRPQEAVSAQVLNATVRSLNAEHPRAVLVTGDLLDSAQRNELDQLFAVLSGGQVDPNSGGEGYRGVQAASNPDRAFYRPSIDEPEHPGLVNRAQQPFVAQGLRAPWYAALGAHDLLVQGAIPPSRRTDALATGGEALLTLDPALRPIADGLARGGEPSPELRGVPRAQLERLLGGVPPGRATRVPPDRDRAAVRPEELVRRLRSAGTPVRPGAERLDYAVDLGRSLRAIVLDTVDRTGRAAGVVTAREVDVLRRELRRAGRRSVVVVTHHALEDARGGEAALALLADDPRVVAELSGATHRNAIRARRTRAGGYWRISTSSLADWPQQARMLRLVTGPDGSRALETWMLDHAGALDGGDLAGFGRQLAYVDAQGGRPQGLAGGRGDRNARLWLPPSR